MDDNRTPRPEEENGPTAWPYERRCPECGKIFCLARVELWAYWDGPQMLCSWGCKRKREKRQAEAAARAAEKRSKMTPRMREAMVRRLTAQGKTDEEICERLGLSRQLINHYKKKIRESGDSGKDGHAEN